jgi:hypothetical protein
MEKTRLASSSLGETGLEVTRAGFGARAIGGSDCSRSAQAAAVRLSGRGPVSGIRLARRGAPRLAAVLIVITSLAGCGAGQLAQTSREVPAITGADSGNGPVVIRDAQIVFGPLGDGSAVYPPGGTAPVQMRVINQGGQADRLLSASSPTATTVAISGGMALPPGGTIVVTGHAPGSSTAPASGTAGAGPSGVPSTEPVEQAQIALVGLADAIQSGLDYPVTFVFEHAGPITLALPVGLPPGPDHAQRSAG